MATANHDSVKKVSVARWLLNRKYKKRLKRQFHAECVPSADRYEVAVDILSRFYYQYPVFRDCINTAYGTSFVHSVNLTDNPAFKQLFDL